MTYKYYVAETWGELIEFEPREWCASLDLEAEGEGLYGSYVRRCLAESAAEHLCQAVNEKGECWEDGEIKTLHLFRVDGYMLGIYNVVCGYVSKLMAAEEPVYRDQTEEKS